MNDQLLDENFSSQDLPDFWLTTKSTGMAKTMANWSKFIAIFGFVYVALNLIELLGSGYLHSSIFFSFQLLFIAVISYQFLRFSINLSNGIAKGSNSLFNECIENIANMLKLVGVLLLVFTARGFYNLFVSVF